MHRFSTRVSKPINSCGNTYAADEDYIDMDVNPAAFLCRPITSSPAFEFNMPLEDNHRHEDSRISPADELFYKGNLLPLHLEPRIQMVQKLLKSCCEDEKIGSSSSLSSKDDTPLQSCNATPTGSCHVSGELNSDECFCECSMNLVSGAHSKEKQLDICECSRKNVCDRLERDSPSSIKKAWKNRLKSIKQSSLSSKLKASRAYFRYLFGIKTDITKPKREEIVLTKPNREEIMHTHNSNLVKLRDYLKSKGIGSHSCVLTTEKEKSKGSLTEDRGHRRSFSDAVKTLSTSQTHFKLVSFSSLPSSGVDHSSGFNQYFLKRSSSVNSDAVQGAIAYCKQSQLCSKRNSSEVGMIFAFAADSRVAVCGTQDRPTLSRG